MAVMKKIDGGVCAATGFTAGGIRCGIRPNQTKKDLELIFSEVPCQAAGVFTKNRVKADPVQLDQENLRDGIAQAVIANSGIANACAPHGRQAAVRMGQIAAERLGIPAENVMVCSTGIIGQDLDTDVIASQIGTLVLRRDGALEAEEAIMTTDTRPKMTAYSFTAGGKTCRIGGICKGAGMIHPNMGTMLCFITTDCAVSSAMIRKALQEDVRVTFNRVSVDGDTSTNDTCLVLANGLAGNAVITEEDADYAAFRDALRQVMQDLAVMVAADGEGATRLLTVHVQGAKDEETAEKLASAVCQSTLTKAAMFGADANWGRVLCACGYSGAEFDPQKADIAFRSAAGEIAVCAHGQGLAFDEDLARKILSQDAVVIEIRLPDGGGDVCCWGCDLTYDYVKINGEYRS